MKLNLIIFASITASFTIYSPLGAFLWLGEKAKPTLENVIQDLQKKQADTPSDPYINYNLGVALHKAGKFGQAEANFDRASIATVDQELKKRCFFNAGNSFYKDALATLPENWEAAEVAPEKCDAAIAKIQQALKKYESVLLLDKQDQQANANKKVAQELLEKLEKKKQKQDKKEQKKDQEKQEQNQDKQDKQQQDKSQQKQEQQKDKQPGQKKPAQEKEEPQQEKGEKKQEEAPSGAEKKQESMEQRGVRALLDALQHDEAKLQKALISKKLKNEGQPQDSSQRPW